MKNQISGKPRIRLSELHDVKKLLRKYNLNTVCEEANCPNISTCFGRQVATFLLMGSVCTRSCGFCNVEHGKLEGLDEKEPENIVKAANALKLKHIVLTSVTRDDLADGGASHFAKTIESIKENMSDVSVEVLVPDFQGDEDSIAKVLKQDIAVFNHNVEMVPTLYSAVRPEASYERSLKVLSYAKNFSKKYKVKSGFMLGLGENRKEVEELIDDLASLGLDILTIGQYYNPSSKHSNVEKYYSKEEFKYFEDYAISSGIPVVYSASNVRSSFNADEFI